MRGVILALCGLVLGQFAHADDLAKEQLFNMWARDFTHKLQGKVLPGWIVIYEEKKHSIKIMRDRAVMSYLVAPNLSGSEPAELAWPSFSFEVTPFVTRKEFSRQKTENEVINKKLTLLYKVLSDTPSVVGIHGWPVMTSTFYSKVPADQAKIDEYYRVGKTLHQLPDGYYQNLSFSWLTPQPLWSSGMVPRDEYVRQEAEAVFKQTNDVFSKY